MLSSMTGFASKQASIPGFGKVSIEIRSTNHKFLDSVLHLPGGFLSLEDRIKKAIEARVKRGRITCVINVTCQQVQTVFVNEPLIRNYIDALNKIKQRFNISSGIELDTIIRLPNVFSVTEAPLLLERIWPKLHPVLLQALDSLIKTRYKEGRELEECLKRAAQALSYDLQGIRKRAKKVISQKCRSLASDEERSCFLKETDIAEELQRLSFHIRNFRSKLLRRGPLGKELDFIAQEMQRESNTIGAKSFDAAISGRVVEMKSQIEKIREQAQNIE